MKRWRKEPNETGLRRVCQRPRGWEFREDGLEIASVRPIIREFEVVGWFFCCGGYNSYAEYRTFNTAEEAKSAAVEYYKYFQAGKEAARV